MGVGISSIVSLLWWLCPDYLRTNYLLPGLRPGDTLACCWDVKQPINQPSLTSGLQMLPACGTKCHRLIHGGQVNLSVCLYVCLFVCLRLSVCLSVFLSVCLSVSLSLSSLFPPPPPPTAPSLCCFTAALQTSTVVSMGLVQRNVLGSVVPTP